MGANQAQFDPNDPMGSYQKATAPTKGEAIGGILSALSPVVASFNPKSGFRNQQIAESQKAKQQAITGGAQQRRGQNAMNLMKLMKGEAGTNDIKEYNFYVKELQRKDPNASPMAFEKFRVMKPTAGSGAIPGMGDLMQMVMGKVKRNLSPRGGAPGAGRSAPAPAKPNMPAGLDSNDLSKIRWGE